MSGIRSSHFYSNCPDSKDQHVHDSGSHPNLKGLLTLGKL